MKKTRGKLKTYYKVSSVDNYWYVTADQLRVDIFEYIAEAGDDGLTINEVMMTEKEFDALPEYQG